MDNITLLKSTENETGWDLGPFAAVLASGKNVSSSNKIQSNYKGLKIAACMHSWGKLWTTRYKKTKEPNCHF